ncbi:RING finger protein 214 isoform X2 [Coregonus clupeaformis]|uniref:RING finger protein 214 isoform X2 n=1 Tax=Coregonus clupeaformis TaxID=59861 RepID=UPI001E1C2669|nr:RING finger protein 214 isoform X2 [Coregonus clupeaformis]
MDDWGLALEEDMARETSATGNPEQQYNPWSNQSNPWSEPGYTSESVGELDKLASGDGHHVTHPKKQEEQGVQTDAWTADKDVNTDQDWESLMSVDEYSTHLALQYEELIKQQEEEEADHGSQVDSLVQKKDEGVHQQQVLLDKIESLRVKLQLNCCKTTRKNFAVKKQELSVEKSKMEEERNRLSQELEETTRKLALLIEEQNQEKLMWERELADLNTEMERLQKESEEATQRALREEVSLYIFINSITALEMQRDVTMSEVDDWLKEADQYINTLGFDPSQQQHMHHRLEWENNVAVVRSSLAGLQNQFKEQLHLLQQGQPMESLPGVTLPHLPQVPTMGPPNGLMSPMMYAPPRPPFQHFQMGPPNGMTFTPQQHHPAAFTAPARVTPPPATSSTPHASALPSHPATPPVFLFTTTMASAQPLSSNNPPAAGKLDNLLKRLGDRFPQCNRTQLMSVLQQIKNSRGTMAGMSIDEVTKQVAQRLAQNEKPAPGPIRPPSADRGIPGHPGPIQRPTHPPQRPAVAQVFQTRPPQPVAVSNRKLCLMCQKHVEADSQHPMSCTHTVHKDVSPTLKNTYTTDNYTVLMRR